MKNHNDWMSPGFNLPSLAGHVGPFAHAAFLKSVASFYDPSSIEIVESDSSLIAFARDDEQISLVGHEDLVDYRSPLGSQVSQLVSQYAEKLDPGVRFRFDSLPGEAAEVIAQGLNAVGIETEPVLHTSAAVLTLPAGFDEYLQLVGKKQRHEIRRKRRRFIEVFGPYDLLQFHESGEGFDQFVDLHRRSDGDKGSFMTDRMRDFFENLIDCEGWELNAIADRGGRIAAAAFGFVDEDGYYLYNSAYDPDLYHASPGVVMLTSLIEKAISEGKKVFDFLKGDETYKARLGAEKRMLFVLEGVR